MNPFVPFALIAVLLQLCIGPHAFAGEPTDQIRAHVEQMFHIVAGPASKEGSPQERQAGVRKIADQMFDWTEMAQRSLGQHWGQRTPAERAEFVQLFADLFEHAYLSQIQLVDAQSFQYLGDTVDGDWAIVRTKVLTKHGDEIDVGYRTRLEGGKEWRVYDLDVQRISLVGNYRAQFNSVISRSSYQELVKKLKMMQEKRGTWIPGSRA